MYTISPRAMNPATHPLLTQRVASIFESLKDAAQSSLRKSSIRHSQILFLATLPYPFGQSASSQSTMSCSVPAFVFATILPAILGVVHALPQIRADKPAAFYLAGDSTTAVQSTNGGGWGNGFLNTTLKNGAIGKNYGHNGATTVSFREGGDWATVLGAVEDAKADYTPYVTIQVSASR